MREDLTRTTLRLRMRQLRATVQRLPDKEKNTYTAVAAALCLALYFGLIWPLGHTRLSKLAYDLEKQAVRDKAAARQPARPSSPPPTLGGKNLVEARRELNELHRQVEDSRNEVARLNASFVPLDDNLAMNALKAGLTSLAEAGDMEVLALEHVYLRNEDKERAPTPQVLQEAAQGNPFKRPLIVMRARASYHGLMQFLDGLSRLPYVAAPVSSDISVQIERHPETRTPVRQWLDVQIKLAV